MEVNDVNVQAQSPGETVNECVSKALLPLTSMAHDLASRVSEDEVNSYRVSHVVRIMHVYKATVDLSRIVDQFTDGDIDQEGFDKRSSDALREMLNNIEDPECDGTDFASPSWWRGHDQGCQVSCRIFEDWIDEPIREPSYGGECFNRAYRKLAGLKAQALGSQPAVSPGLIGTEVHALGSD